VENIKLKKYKQSCLVTKFSPKRQDLTDV